MPDTSFAAHAVRIIAERAADQAKALQAMAELLAQPGPNLPLIELRQLLARIGFGIAPMDVLQTAVGAFETWAEDDRDPHANEQFDAALKALHEATRC